MADSASTKPESKHEIVARISDSETIAEGEAREIILLAERKEISIVWSRYGPGERGPRPQVHRERTVAFYVLEGALAFELGAEAKRITVPAGGFVAVPPNVAHSFANEGRVNACLLTLHAPDKGFAAFLRARRDGQDAPFDSFDPSADGGSASEAIVSDPAEGERIASGNLEQVFKGVLPSLSFAEWTLEGPWDGPAAHHHDNQVDSCYVLEGELDVTIEGSVHRSGPNTLASIPRGIRHTFSHSGRGRTRVLNFHAPDGGFADAMRRTPD